MAWSSARLVRAAAARDTVEKKVKHPAVLACEGEARQKLLG